MWRLVYQIGSTEMCWQHTDPFIRPRPHACGSFWKRSFFSALWPPVPTQLFTSLNTEVLENTFQGGDFKKRCLVCIHGGQLKWRFWETLMSLPQLAHGNCCSYVLHMCHKSKMAGYQFVYKSVTQPCHPNIWVSFLILFTVGACSRRCSIQTHPVLFCSV